ncbi:hypothetical protein CCYA_CCYA07G2033 [Cyanidiococcus yangmingshanensis]|nr:hypothetical protein CCYA_CCYA07G2033 [Cyanidiococcus yangmingshanensis]
MWSSPLLAGHKHLPARLQTPCSTRGVALGLGGTRRSFQRGLRKPWVRLLPVARKGHRLFKARSNFELPNLQTFQFDESSALALKIERAESLKFYENVNVHVLYLSQVENSEGSPEEYSQGRGSLQRGDKTGAILSGRSSDLESERVGNSSKDRKLLPLFLEDKLERDIIVSGIAQMGTKGTDSHRASIGNSSATPVDTKYRWSLARFFWRNRDALVEAQRIQKIVRGRSDIQGRDSNLLLFLTRSIMQSTTTPRAHELLLQIFREKLKCSVLQVVLAPVTRANPDQLRAYVCLEAQNPQRQPWFVRMRASDGAVIAFRAGCPLFVDKNVWEYAAIDTDSIPLGDSVVFPRRRDSLSL